VSSRTARAIQKNPVSKKTNKQTNKQKELPWLFKLSPFLLSSLALLSLSLPPSLYMTMASLSLYLLSFPLPFYNRALKPLLKKKKKKKKKEPGVVTQVFNPSTREAEAGRRISEFGASLVYRVSSRIARATQRNPILKNNNNKKSCLGLER
jgi:hypothetical protein